MFSEIEQHHITSLHPYSTVHQWQIHIGHSMKWRAFGGLGMESHLYRSTGSRHGSAAVDFFLPWNGVPGGWVGMACMRALF